MGEDPVTIAPTTPLRIYGDRIYQTVIQGTHDLEAVFDFADTAKNSYFIFEDMQLMGAKHGIRSAMITNSIFRNLWFDYCNDAALAIGYGWTNRVEDCAFSFNGDHIRTIAGDVNMLNIANCNFEKATGIGLNFPYGLHGLRVTGCVFESIPGPAIVIGSNVFGFEISNNYFEQNCISAGYQLTDPDRAIKAQIVINGRNEAGVVGTSAPAGGARIANNAVILSHAEQSDYFVACYSAFGELEVTGNAFYNNQPDRTQTLVLTGTSKTGRGARVEGLRIAGNGEYTPAPTMTMIDLEVDDLAGGATQLHDAAVDGIVATNYSESLVRFAPVSRPAKGTWRKAPARYRRQDVWELSGDANAGAWGFSIDMADYPELGGKYVYFACLAKASDPDARIVLSTSQLGPQDAGPATDTEWRVVSYVDKLPTSGLVTFSVRMVADSASAVVSLSRPVLSEVGVPYNGHIPV